MGLVSCILDGARASRKAVTIKVVMIVAEKAMAATTEVIKRNKEGEEDKLIHTTNSYGSKVRKAVLLPFLLYKSLIALLAIRRGSIGVKPVAKFLSCARLWPFIPKAP